MRLSFLLVPLLIFAITGYSCKDNGSRFIKEGEIHYNIEYAGNTGPIPTEFLPHNLIVSFKENKILFEMLSSFGNSGILNLANPEKGIYDTYFSFFTVKYFYESKQDEIYPGFESMKNAVIKKTSKTSTICGFNCKSAEITFPKCDNKSFEIWYTNEINVVNPNTCTPYSSIDGVLMSFVFVMGPTELHFTAETVYKKDIPDNQFERRAKFIRVSRDDINKFINKMTNI